MHRPPEIGLLMGTKQCFIHLLRTTVTSICCQEPVVHRGGLISPGRRRSARCWRAGDSHVFLPLSLALFIGRSSHTFHVNETRLLDHRRTEQPAHHARLFCAATSWLKAFAHLKRAWNLFGSTENGTDGAFFLYKGWKSHWTWLQSLEMLQQTGFLEHKKVQ